MAKKFVKSDMFNSNKEPDKTYKPRPNPNQSYQPQERPRRTTNQYTEKTNYIDLRKYYEVVSALNNPEIQKVISKFPRFFCEASLGYEPVHHKYQGKSEKAPIPAETQQEEICNWDSDGEIDLGVGVLDKTKLKKYQCAAPLKSNELKRHEKQFLEDEIRRKIQQEEQISRDQKSKPDVIDQPKKVQITQRLAPPVVKKIVIKSPSQSHSDDQIQIVKTTQYYTRLQEPPIEIERSRSKSFSVMSDQEGQDDRFKDSESSDDIFGEKEDNDAQEEPQSQESISKKDNGFGHIQYAKGQFQMFALSQGMKPDDEAWIMSDGNTVSKKFSSIQMDRDYRSSYYGSYPLINFVKYSGYTSYLQFNDHPDSKLFLHSKPQMMNNYQQPVYEQQKNKRKYSNNQQYESGNKPRNRRQSAAQYRPKKNQFV